MPEASDPCCPDCGGPLDGFGPEDSCAGVRCPTCGWAAVTTNTEHPHFQMSRDEKPYDVWVEWAGRDRRRVIAAVGNALGIGAGAARALIDGGLPIATGVRALEVKNLHSRIRAIGLDLRVQPEFPWRLD